MNILIVGGGGREHAFGWKIKQSDKVKDIFFAPGNAGTIELGTNLPYKVTEFDKIKAAVKEHNISLVVVGPEEPLVKGIVESFKSDESLSDVMIIGPSQQGAMLEGSKEFAKQFMFRHNIPTARYLAVTTENIDEGKEFLKSLDAPYVLKADGLAAGKGVLILDDYNEACEELDNMLNGKFGEAGNTVVIEEFLSGIELSVFVLTDGKDYVILPEAKDYKRIGEGDTGLNTGGMGAVSPVPFASKEFMDKIENQVVIPTIEGIQKDNLDFKGFVFLGLIKVGEEPYVIEYNVRMGDPETEAVLPRLNNDLVELLVATGKGELSKHKAEHISKSAVTVVLVSGGYPSDDYRKGDVITNLKDSENSMIFHSGTSLKDGEVITSGGRVLALTSLADSMEEALKGSLSKADEVTYDGKYYRKDIGFDLM